MKSIFARQGLRDVLRAVLPVALFTRIQSTRSRNYQSRLMQQWGVDDLTRRFVERYGDRVLYGPFTGMQYPSESLKNRNVIPRLLGSYESQLHSYFAEAARRDYEAAIDIGCAEGYYAVGFACMGLRTVAFDTHPGELALARKMAALNGVAEHITFRSWCNRAELLRFSGKRVLIVSDCEGYETELFTTDVLNALRASDLLIELHGDAKDVLLTAAGPTHECQLIQSATDLPRYSELDVFSLEDAAKALSEYRSPGQEWLFLQSTSIRVQK